MHTHTPASSGAARSVEAAPQSTSSTPNSRSTGRKRTRSRRPNASAATPPAQSAAGRTPVRPGNGTPTADNAANGKASSSRAPRRAANSAASSRTGRPAQNRDRRGSRGGGRTQTVTGTYSHHHRGFGFIDLDTPITAGETTIDSAFVNPSLATRLLAGDKVSADIAVTGTRAAARTVTVTARPRTHVFGRITATGNGPLVCTPDPHVGTGTFVVGAKVTAKPGDWVYAEFVETAGKDSLGRVVTVQDRYPTLTPAALRQMMFARFDLAQGRDAAVDAAAVAAAARGRAALTGPVPTNRTDHRGTPTFTVDGASTRDLDDAISATIRPDGSVRVSVHIADVSALVTPGSILDDDASAYATSIYLPGWNRPMLPPQLSEDVLSLLPGVPRDTLSVSYTVTGAGTLTDIVVERARIVSDARLTYTGASAALAGASDAPTLTASVATALGAAHTASELLGAERSARLVLGERQRPLPSWEPTVTGGPADPDSDPYTGAHLAAAPSSAATVADEMIERLMVAANEAVATWLVARDLPGVFRVHEEPSADLGDDITALVPFLPKTVRTKVDVESDGVETLAVLADELATHDVTDRLVDVLLMRHLRRATYTAQRGDHYGLGSTGYVHFTSPIRRYADLLVHRVITAHLDGDADAVDLMRAELDAAAEHVTTMSWTAARVESGFRRFATELLYSTQARGPVAGVVTGFGPAGVFVSAPEHGTSGVLPFTALDGEWTADGRNVAATQAGTGTTLTLGSRVWVTADAVDPGVAGITWARAKRPTRRSR